jgi:N-acetylneuraminate synthase/sialic acid synthase
MRELTIAGRRIADDAPCYVIAELGSNHQGQRDIALQMITAAKTAGVSAVKLQKRHNATLYTQDLLDRPYDNENSFGLTYGAHRAALEFKLGDFLACQSLAIAQGLPCFATAFDEESADFLESLNVPAYKIASGGLTDLDLLAHVARKGKPIILSTGGGTMDDIDRAVDAIWPLNTQLALLHCTASYPSTFEDLNLCVIETLRERYPLAVIGWSCHIHNLSMAMAAYALGARIIEVHFTLNRSMKGTDHAFSLEPATLTKMVKDLNRLQVALGDGVKRWLPSEVVPISKMRRTWTGHQWQIAGTPTSSTSTGLSVAPKAVTTTSPSPFVTESK